MGRLPLNKERRVNRFIGTIVLVSLVLLSGWLLGCSKTPEQEPKIDSMQDTVSDGAGQVKESASDAADQVKESAAQMKESADQYIDDSAITAKVKEQLVAEPVTKAYQISVETLNGTVQLSGFVQTQAERSKAEEIAGGVSGVESVRNDLILKSKTESRYESRKIRTA